MQVVRDVFAILTVVFGFVTLFYSFEVRLTNKKLRDELRLISKKQKECEDKLDYYENSYIPGLKEALEDAKKEATRLAASKTERDVEYLINGIEKLLNKKTQ